MNRVARGKVLSQLIERCLRDGRTIEIDGMGTFQFNEEDEIVFAPSGRDRVFLAYAQEDRAMVRKLYQALRKAGFDPWMDQQNLIPGQNWPRAIERAIELADFVVACFSRRSTVKRGHFQCELRYALDVAAKVPAENIFFIPARLNECELPRQIAKTTHYVDLFPSWDRGLDSLIGSMRTHPGDPSNN